MLPMVSFRVIFASWAVAGLTIVALAVSDRDGLAGACGVAIALAGIFMFLRHRPN